MQKLIKIKEDHYVVVDDSEIQEGDWYIDDVKQVRQSVVQSIISDEVYWHRGYMKITHSTRPLENERITNPTTQIIRDAMKMVEVRKPKVVRDGLVKPIVELLSFQEVKELIGEVDVDKRIYDTDFRGDVNSYKQGYNQALEDNKEKKYTEEDLGLFLEYVRDNYTGMGAPHLVHNKGGQRKTKVIVQDYIQSLQPKTKWEVEMVDGKLKLK